MDRIAELEIVLDAAGAIHDLLAALKLARSAEGTVVAAISKGGGIR